MSVRWFSWWRWAPVLVWLVALLPRAVSLGAFVTADEPMWLERSIWFVGGVAQGDAGLLWRSVYGDTIGAPASALPGLLPMPLPLVGFGVTAFLTSALTGGPAPGQYAYSDTIVLLGQTAWFTVLLTSLTIVAAYWLLVPLWDRPAALLAALTLALDPYFIGLSRVVGVDALLGSLMLLATLALLRATAGESRQRAWNLGLAGAGALLALLTKTPALFLLPFAGVVLVYSTVRGAGLPARSNGKPKSLPHFRFLIAGLGWMLVVLVIAFAVLALVWQDAGRTLNVLVDAVSAGVTQAHEGGSYAFGTPGQPLDASFYAWVLALRATPFTLVGLALAVGAGLVAIRRWREPHIGAVLLLSVYLVGFWTMMTLGAKKQDRYILPALQALDLLAAWGWWAALRWASGRLPRLRDHADHWALGIGGVLLLLVTPCWLRLHPYYLAAYNPLLGGSKTAAWAYAVGWGEGLDQTAAYLRAAHADPADVVVAAHMAQALGAEFPGFVVPLTTDTQFVADYVVLYYADAMRNVPETWVIDRFRSRQPAHIAWIDGVPYAGVYANEDLEAKLITRQAPAPAHPLETPFSKAIACVGYDDLPTMSIAPGESVSLTLYWSCRGPIWEDYRVFVHLTDKTGQTWGQWDNAPLAGRFPTTLWQPGMYLRDQVRVMAAENAPTGTYYLHLGLYKTGTNKRLRIVGTDQDHLIIGPITIR